MFYNRCFSKMKRKLRPTKSLYKLENEQVSFLLEEIDKNLEEYKKNSRNKDKQLAEVKKKTVRSKKQLRTSYKRK